MILEGAVAPSFEAPSTGGKFRLRDAVEAGTLVLFFYPKAATPGCTNECVEFEAWFDRFDELGVRLAGCSIDSLDDQKAFSAKHGGFRFPLIADTDGAIAKAYDVMMQDRDLAKRCTAVISEAGDIVKTYPDAPRDGKGHAEQVYADAAGLFA